MPNRSTRGARPVAVWSALLVLATAGGFARAEDNVPPKGFQALFNGKDLSGWQGLIAGGDPKKILALSPAERRAAQEKADAELAKHWKVADGAIVNPDGKGTYLCTVEEFGDFELLVDWWIAPGADSGIYLRGVPQVQIWDPVHGIDQAKVGSGGLYNNQKGPSKPLELADRPAGEWNTFRIVMVGDDVSIWLNDKLVVNEVPLENYWERGSALYPVGPLQFQTHGGELRFRNIFLREIPRHPPESGTLAYPHGAGNQPPIEAGTPVGDGWVDLLAKGLEGWQHEPQYWSFADGVVTGRMPGDPKHHYAYTDREFSDFELHAWVWMEGKNANSGVCVRVQPTSFDDCPGYQLDMGEGFWGSLWDERGDGMVAKCPDDVAKRVVREGWNHWYVIVRGDHLVGWLNGVRTFEAVHRRGAKKGRIGLQLAHGADRDFTARFQKIWVREIGERFYLDYTGEDSADGFAPLFNGKDLSGWIGNVGGYAAEDGKLVCKRRGGGNLYTERPYGDFVLRFEFKLEPGANNGVGVRARFNPFHPEGAKYFDAAYHGMEIQVLENSAPGYRYLQPFQYHGSVYGVSAAKRGFQKPIGYWNHEEISAVGDRITVKLNGEVITDVKLHELATPELVKSHPGVFNQLGYIGFLGHGHRIEFRDIRVRELR